MISDPTRDTPSRQAIAEAVLAIAYPEVSRAGVNVAQWAALDRALDEFAAAVREQTLHAVARGATEEGRNGR
jgi:hypothetical protein